MERYTHLTSEGAGGLIRQCFPKSYDLSTIRTSQLAHVVDQSITDRAKPPPVPFAHHRHCPAGGKVVINFRRAKYAARAILMSSI